MKDFVETLVSWKRSSLGSGDFGVETTVSCGVKVVEAGWVDFRCVGFSSCQYDHAFCEGSRG